MKILGYAPLISECSSSWRNGPVFHAVERFSLRQCENRPSHHLFVNLICSKMWSTKCTAIVSIQRVFWSTYWPYWQEITFNKKYNMVCLNYWRSTEGLTLGDNSLDRCDLYKEVLPPGKSGADFTAKIRNGRPYRYMQPQRVWIFSRFGQKYCRIRLKMDMFFIQEAAFVSLSIAP